VIGRTDSITKKVSNIGKQSESAYEAAKNIKHRAKQLYREGFMKQKLIEKPMKIDEVNFDQLYEEISKDWRSKSRKLQERRWGEITHKKHTAGTSARHVLGTKFWVVRI
jgi:hypothetical protein